MKPRGQLSQSDARRNICQFYSKVYRKLKPHAPYQAFAWLLLLSIVPPVRSVVSFVAETVRLLVDTQRSVLVANWNKHTHLTSYRNGTRRKAGASYGCSCSTIVCGRVGADGKSLTVLVTNACRLPVFLDRQSLAACRGHYPSFGLSSAQPCCAHPPQAISLPSTLDAPFFTLPSPSGSNSRLSSTYGQDVGKRKTIGRAGARPAAARAAHCQRRDGEGAGT